MGSYPNDAETLWDFDIPACDLNGALIAYKEQSGVHYLSALQEPVFTHAVRGKYTARRALDLLLKGTNCQVTGSPPQVYIGCSPRAASLNTPR